MDSNIASPVTLHGIGASAGIAAGAILVYQPVTTPSTTSRGPATPDPEHERALLKEAMERAASDLRDLVERVRTEVGEEESGIFEAQAMMLEDPTIIERATQIIEQDHQEAASALRQASEEQATELAALPDPTWQARAADVRDAASRAIRYLALGSTSQPLLADLLGQSSQPVIVAAEDLAPSDTVQMPLDRVAGLITARGSTTAHAAILARARGIPAVVGAGNALWEHARNGDTVVLDGTHGTITIHPDAQTLAQAQHAMEAHRKQAIATSALAARWRDKPGATRDGHPVPVMANVGSIEDAHQAAEMGAEGIGLLRTEFLFAQKNTLPTEDEQVESYTQIIEALGASRGPIIIRTLDAGADKPLASLASLVRDLPEEVNPALGVRGIRLHMRYPDLLRTQLRAIVRAASQTHADVRIMLPMVASVDEVRMARAMLSEISAEPLVLGIMVETPAAVFTADVLAREAAFFSIGSNDLTQYVLAADRLNSTLAAGCRPEHPAVLRAIAHVARAATDARRESGVCGEMAGDPRLGLLLVGLGITELSMNPARIPYVKDALARHRLPELRVMAEHALEATTLQNALDVVAGFE
jgi:phosphoenolpyruvate-protein phosphotransferase